MGPMEEGREGESEGGKEEGWGNVYREEQARGGEEREGREAGTPAASHPLVFVQHQMVKSSSLL